MRKKSGRFCCFHLALAGIGIHVGQELDRNEYDQDKDESDTLERFVAQVIKPPPHTTHLTRIMEITLTIYHKYGIIKTNSRIPLNKV